MKLQHPAVAPLRAAPDIADHLVRRPQAVTSDRSRSRGLPKKNRTGRCEMPEASIRTRPKRRPALSRAMACHVASLGLVPAQPILVLPQPGPDGVLVAPGLQSLPSRPSCATRFRTALLGDLRSIGTPLDAAIRPSASDLAAPRQTPWPCRSRAASAVAPLAGALPLAAEKPGSCVMRGTISQRRDLSCPIHAVEPADTKGSRTLRLQVNVGRSRAAGASTIWRVSEGHRPQS